MPTFTPGELKTPAWLLEVLVADRGHFRGDETDGRANAETARVERGRLARLTRMDGAA